MLITVKLAVCDLQSYYAQSLGFLIQKWGVTVPALKGLVRIFWKKVIQVCHKYTMIGCCYFWLLTDQVKSGAKWSVGWVEMYIKHHSCSLRRLKARNGLLQCSMKSAAFWRMWETGVVIPILSTRDLRIWGLPSLLVLWPQNWYYNRLYWVTW